MDIVGNTILILSVVAILLALAWGGTVHAWSSWRTIVPLVLGFVGLLAFLGYEATPLVKEPTMPILLGLLLPPRLFPGGAGCVADAFGSDALPHRNHHGALWCACGDPHHRHRTLPRVPLPRFRADDRGLLSLHPARPALVHGGVGGIPATVRRRRRHRLHQLFAGDPGGAAESEVATAAATWTFLCSFSSIWGTAIPSAIFNSRVNALAGRVPDAAVRALLVDGGAYERAAFLRSWALRPSVRRIVLGIYIDSLRTVWQVSIAFAGIGIPIALLVKGLKLREELNTEFGLEEKKDQPRSQG